MIQQPNTDKLVFLYTKSFFHKKNWTNSRKRSAICCI